MRKFFWQISASLDGFMEGPNRELADTAGLKDPDYDRYASAMLQSIDAVVLGRVTYELFAGYWPSAKGPDAERMNHLPKFVFTRTLQELKWTHSRRVGVEEIVRLKREPGRDIAIFGSATMAAELLRQGLIDEVRLLVSPVVLGRGNRAFRDLERRIGLDLEKVERWSSGAVALFYRTGVAGSN